MAEEYADRDVVLVTVSYDDTDEDIRAFLEANQYRFLVVRDDREHGVTGPIYQVGPIPTLLLIDRRGRIAYRHVGYEHGDEQELRAELEAALVAPGA